jgi:hypothetical protein
MLRMKKNTPTLTTEGQMIGNDPQRAGPGILRRVEHQRGGAAGCLAQVSGSGDGSRAEKDRS